MANWREIKLYDRHRRADIYATGHYNRPKATNITPFKIFIQRIKKDKRFKNLRGYSSWTLSIGNDMQYHKRWYRDKVRREPSNWYLYIGEGNRRAIIQLPEWDELRCEAFLKILWVPPEIGGCGVGSEVIDVLKSHVRTVDDMCKSGEKYQDKHITCNSFIIYLIPNSFVVLDGYWNVADIEEGTDLIDWTSDPEAEEREGDPDYKIVDETWKNISKDDVRLSLKDLKSFYVEKHGFVECIELGIHEYFNWETGRVHRDLNITPRSVCHQRWPLLWPPENLPFHERDTTE